MWKTSRKKPKHTCKKTLWKLLPKTDGCVCPYQHNYTNVIQQMVLAGKTLKKKKSTPNKRNDISCIIKIKSVSTKSTTLSKDKRNHCGKALFCVWLAIRKTIPLDTPFSTKTSSANGFAVAHRCFSFQGVTAAAHVRLRDKF